MSKPIIFLDLDYTLYEKQPWGGIISRDNCNVLRDLKNDMRLVINTGRPQGQVESSFLRSGNEGSKESWQDLPVDKNILPLSIFAAGIYEDGLIVKVKEGSDYTTIFNSLDIATPKYLELRKRLFSQEAQEHFRDAGIELILKNSVTREKEGYAERNQVTGEVLRRFDTELTPLYEQCNETTKLTYKPVLANGWTGSEIRKEGKEHNATTSLLSKINPDWKEELGIDLPEDAIDMFPFILEGKKSGEIFRKGEANKLLLDHWKNDKPSSIVYIGDGPNDVKAMADLENNYNGQLLFLAPYKSNAKVIEFMNGAHRSGAYAKHFGENVTIDSIMIAAAEEMHKHRIF